LTGPKSGSAANKLLSDLFVVFSPHLKH